MDITIQGIITNYSCYMIVVQGKCNPA